MLRTILFLALLAVPTMAQARAPIFLLGPGTYAARALCPPTLNLTAWPNLTANWPPLGPSNQFCVNGRVGITFTVPPGPVLTVLITFGVYQVPSDPKVVVNRDCAEGAETTCTAKHTPGTRTATASGVFTYPGDIDWILLPDDGVYATNWFTTKPGCFASGKMEIRDGRQYLAALGGPSGCTYTVTSTAQ